MNNLYFVLLLAVSQFFSSTETPNSPEKETPILKDSIPFVCGQPDGYDDFLKQHPDVLEKQNRWEREQKKRLETKQSIARRGTAYEIPVVIHIIHDNGTENISDAESQWFLALALLKANRMEEAKAQLELIVRNGGWNAGEAGEILERF